MKRARVVKAFFGRVAVLVLLLLPGQVAQAARSADINFPQTGMTLSDAHGFLSYWQANGGLAQFGYPLSPETNEVSPTDGRVYITQWFERTRFEWHPESPSAQYRVLLGLLGRDLTKGRAQEAAFKPAPNPNNSNCLYFTQTGHSLCHSFRDYWQAHGGLALYGYPISEELSEKSPTDGKQYTVQYFERNRFEWHPENVGTPYAVLLGLLGSQLGGFPIPALPGHDTQIPLQVADKFKSGGRSSGEKGNGNSKWNAARTLLGPPGTQINLFGTAVGPRMLAVAPNGDLFVSDTRAGKVYALPDRDNDGVSDSSTIFAENIEKPHGLAFHGNFLYVATEKAVLRFPYAWGQLQAQGTGQKIADLPSGPSRDLVTGINHDTRSLTFGLDGKIYVSVGSDCDLCEGEDPKRAAILQLNEDGTGLSVFAGGLRNAVGIDFDPRTGRLWASVNERNSKGNDTPPDLLTPIGAGGDYGWPYCSGIPLQPDPQFGKPAAFCASKQSAPVGLPAHIAPLGIRFYNGGGRLPKAYDYGIFVANHGSALHTPPYGYDVRFLSLRPGKMAQGAQVTISGWLVGSEFWGRPVDVAFGKDGAMYISDDFAGAVYRVVSGQ